MKRRWSPSVVLCLLLSACQLGSSPGSTTTVFDSAGITVVENGGQDTPLNWRLVQIASVGDEAVEAVQLTDLTEFTVDADTLGHFYVNDAWFGQRVQLFDTTGRFLRSLTRKGEGPGEIGEGVSVSVSGDGVLAVTDFTKAAIVRVRWDGAVLPSVSLIGYDLFGAARVSADTVVIHTLDSGGKGGPEQIQYRTRSDTATLIVHAPERLGWLPFCRDGMEGLTPMLAPDLRWTARGSRVATHHTAEYRIDTFDGVRLTMSLRRDVPAITGSVEAVRRFFPNGKVVASRDCIVSPKELVTKRGVARKIQPLRRLAIDPEGRIWAERNTFPDESPRTDVFDASGRYLGTLGGFGAPLGFPARDILLFALPDSAADKPVLGVFRLVR